MVIDRDGDGDGNGNGDGDDGEDGDGDGDGVCQGPPTTFLVCEAACSCFGKNTHKTRRCWRVLISWRSG